MRQSIELVYKRAAGQLFKSNQAPFLNHTSVQVYIANATNMLFHKFVLSAVLALASAVASVSIHARLYSPNLPVFLQQVVVTVTETVTVVTVTVPALSTSTSTKWVTVSSPSPTCKTFSRIMALGSGL